MGQNLSRIPFGRMQRRHDERRNQTLLDELAGMARANDLRWEPSSRFISAYRDGASEIELVRSGLDDTMRGACQSMREIWHSRTEIPVLRTAAYCTAVERIAQAYRSKGP